MVKKKLDSRIKTLVENGVKLRHRTMFVIVGDNGKDQVVNLHYLLSNTHKQKRMKEIKRKVQRGLIDPDKDDPFELFVSSTQVRWTYYKESHKVLGNTYGVCVLQDFEALTPNLLARTIETVEGGGLVILLLKTMDSLKQLYTLTMDVHSRFRTESHNEVVGRFNERFLLSLGTCKDALVVDDELNILSISNHVRSIEPVYISEDAEKSPEEKELAELKATLRDTNPVGPLLSICKTLDQARAILTFCDSLSEKTLNATVSLTAARGRGKSAALGLVIAGALAYGYSNIFVTSPSPENLKTLFEFVLKGLDALNYQEHIDYELILSTNPELENAIVRINIFRSHRQTLQYIAPSDADKLGNAELVVIDEAAAIPLPLVKKMLGPYLVFLASTINGYEGTGRSLSLKLLQQLRDSSKTKSTGGASSGRTLKEVELKEPIRYANGDNVEKWLNSLLCLDACNMIPSITSGSPHPSECDLYYVDRDTLFSYHSASESFLHQLMAFFVSSHYKNSPNDLQLMADAPAHHLFVLLGPVTDSASQGKLPDVLAVIQVCHEGKISKKTMLNSLARGKRASGDLIPWTISQQYQDHEFASLSGCRVVRIATHPTMQNMGYGSRALDLLAKYYEGDLTSIADPDEHEDDENNAETSEGNASQNGDAPGNKLLSEAIRPKKCKNPLLTPVSERKPERLDYLGVSYGATPKLFKFWRRSGYKPVYIRLTANDLTAEHTCVMIKALKSSTAEEGWLEPFIEDFHKRFIHLLGYGFRHFDPSLVLSVLEPKGVAGRKADADMDKKGKGVSVEELERTFTGFDLKRLEAYSRNMLDYHVVLDLVPLLSALFFSNKIKGVHLSASQAAILAGMGLQYHSVDDMCSALGLDSRQILANFNKAIVKIHGYFQGIREKAAESTLAIGDKSAPEKLQALDIELADEENELERDTKKELEHRQELLLKALDTDRYAVPTAITANVKIGESGVVSLPRDIEAAEERQREIEKRKKKEKEEREQLKNKKKRRKSSGATDGEDTPRKKTPKGKKK